MDTNKNWKANVYMKETVNQLGNFHIQKRDLKRNVLLELKTRIKERMKDEWLSIDLEALNVGT